MITADGKADPRILPPRTDRRVSLSTVWGFGGDDAGEATVDQSDVDPQRIASIGFSGGPERFGYGPADPAGGIQGCGRILENHLKPIPEPAQTVIAAAGHILPVKAYPACSRFLKLNNGAGYRGFAATRLTD